MSSTETTTLRTTLARHTRKGDLSIPMENNWVRCVACGHRCKIGPDHEGICKIRFNKDGVLYVPFGYVGSLQVDPIEKKPFFHVLPGSNTLSFGMLGCDYHCAYCQNWFTSQAIRDPEATAEPQIISAEELVLLALKHDVPVLTSTYNEPLITSEWAVKIFRIALSKGIRCAYVSNGNGTPEVLEYIRPFVQFYKIDLKSFRQKNYQQLGGKLDNVLDSVRTIKQMGIWLEIVTLVVPGFNDSDEELQDIAKFLISVSPEIPWHVTAFHQDYKMTDPENTSSAALVRAAEIGKREGLQFVYAGNLPGELANLENTYCPSCRTLLIERHGFMVRRNLLHNGCCPKCNSAIPGVWN